MKKENKALKFVFKFIIVFASNTVLYVPIYLLFVSCYLYVVFLLEVNEQIAIRFQGHYSFIHLHKVFSIFRAHLSGQMLNLPGIYGILKRTMLCVKTDRSLW